MKIPIFLSCPTTLNRRQEIARSLIVRELSDLQMEPRALGRSDYPAEYPLREVFIIAKHCSGGIILGFEQLWVKAATLKRGTKAQTELRGFGVPTPWNHLEAGILFGLKLPLLIFREESITGGVFDNGVTDVFVHTMPVAKQTSGQRNALKEVFLKWQARVQEHYTRY